MRIVIALFIGITGAFFASSASAAPDPNVFIRDAASYSGVYVGQSMSDPIELEVGETKTVVFRFKNKGTATWKASGSRFISAHTVIPHYDPSPFTGPTWLSKSETAKITKDTPPGGIAELAVTLTGAGEPGIYTEHFHLAAQDFSWVKGGHFWAQIKVVPKKAVVVETPKEEADTTNTVAEEKEEIVEVVQAKRMAMSKKSIAIAGGEEVPLTIIYRNSGDIAWENYAIIASGSDFADDSWQAETVVKEMTKTVAPGGIVKEKITFRAPKNKGTYSATFKLVVDGEVMSSADGTVSVSVTENAPQHYRPPTFSKKTETIPVVGPRLSSEPKLRVRLIKPETYLQFRPMEDDYIVYAGDEKMGTLARKRMAVLEYKDEVHTYKTRELKFESEEPIRLVPATNERAVFQIDNLDRSVSGKCIGKCRSYRGAFELRENHAINELLMSDYMKGIAETSNGAPIEYIKGLLTAARTYAHYIKESSGKWSKHGFDVVGSTADQLYLGHESEILMPNVVKAVEATRGYMITYDLDEDPSTESNIIITPYFGNSDGRTRSWTQVWGGSHKPWLVPVTAKYDAGRRMFGHGVGMSARDAAYRADLEGDSWQELIKYYYTGVDIERIY